MACQQVGSRRWKLLVVATVVLCFLHLPINGWRQALAVPGSGREATRASLQKLKVQELKKRLREKGLKVSGKKADLVERLMEALPKMRKIPEALKIADPATDVFIPLDETVQKLEALLQEERVVFLRAGVASGKSTLAQESSRLSICKFILLLLGRQPMQNVGRRLCCKRFPPLML